MTADSPPAILADVAPCNFNVLHVHRQLAAGGPTRGGGLAIIYNESVTVRPIDLPVKTAPSSFEVQLVSLGSSSPNTIIMNIYQPPSSSMSTFLDEVADLVAAVGVNTPGMLLLCGDLNCPGLDSGHPDADMADLIDSFVLTQLVHQPTRDENLLDVLATEDPTTISDLFIDAAGLISDHRLLTPS